jgi:hypothetical protein
MTEWGLFVLSSLVMLAVVLLVVFLAVPVVVACKKVHAFGESLVTRGEET